VQNIVAVVFLDINRAAKPKADSTSDTDRCQAARTKSSTVILVRSTNSFSSFNAGQELGSVNTVQHSRESTLVM
jgi:hypothetical protein